MTYSVRYSLLLSIQTFLFVSDLFFNALTEFAKARPELQLVLFIFQDVLIIMSLTVMFVSFFSTYILQAGLVDLLFDKFRLTLLVSVSYLFYTISLHIWLLTERWNDPLNYEWSTSLVTYFICQRLFSPFYYYSIKRAILRISDPRFYQSLAWMAEKMMQET
ncbi:UNVERIFIED_CONTAM: hypothetical protein PYX00_002377 [Menopon gallinae]|uniref:Transmembrane protein 138 n=1 Tax=Menopon gallinae TaxID=328185 RepID=A0AAW2IH51_9NEOP